MTKKKLFQHKMGKASSSGTNAIVMNTVFYTVCLYALVAVIANRVATKEQKEEDSENWINKVIAQFNHDEKYILPALIGMGLVVAASTWLACTYQFPMSFRKLK